MADAVAATWIDVGKTSFDDWLAFTWSLGWTSRPSDFVASEASTSLVFMLLDVPEPVWKTSIGNWSSCRPVATSSAAMTMASAMSCSMMPSSAFALAHAALIWARARIWADSMGVPEIGKFSTARWVCARQRASAGTLISPMVSCSMRYSVMFRTIAPAMRARRWQHDGMNVTQWIFIGGGVVFLLAALFLREIDDEGAQITALTFGLIGFFWLVPQLIILVARSRRSP